MANPTERGPCSEPDCGKPYLAKGLCKRHYQRQRRQDNPESALTYSVRSFYGLPNFPMIPDGWIAAQQRRQLHSCPRCSLPLADRSRFRCVFSVPLDKGGSASVDNLILICRSCSMAPVGRLRTNDDDPISGGSPIRQQRMQSGLSLRLMSRQLGISAQYLSDIERGRRAAPLDMPAKIQEVLEIVR